MNEIVFIRIEYDSIYNYNGEFMYYFSVYQQFRLLKNYRHLNKQLHSFFF